MGVMAMIHLIVVILLAGAVFAGSNQASAAMQTITPREAGATSSETLKTGAQKINANFSEHEGEINALSADKANKSGTVMQWSEWADGASFTTSSPPVAYNGSLYKCTTPYTKVAGETPNTQTEYFTEVTGAGTGIAHATSDGNYYASRNGEWANLAGAFVATETDPVFSAWDKDYTDLINTPAIPAALADLGDDATHRIVTDAEKSAWNAKLGALPTWLPSTGPTADNQIIQATGAGTSGWTSVVNGLINDAGTGSDDLLSASEIAIRIAAAAALKQDALGYTPENAANKGVANGYASLGVDGLVPASQLPAASGTDDQIAAEVGVSVANFGGNLGAADDTVQKALDTLDDMTGGGTVDLTAPGPIGSVTPNTGNFTTVTASSFDTLAPATGETGEIGLAEDPANGTNTITLKAPAAMGADLIFTLPSGYAAASDYALVGDTTGALTFAQVLLPSNIGATVQAYDADLADLADGLLTGTKVNLSALAGTIYSTGALYGRTPIVAKTATATLTAQECSSSLVSNTGATAAIVLTLPDAVAGMRITIALTDAYDVDINPYDTERIISLTDADGDAISSDAIAGSYITLVAVSATQWMQVGGTGTWSDVN